MPQLHTQTDSGLNRGEKTTPRTDNSSYQDSNAVVLMHLSFHLIGLQNGMRKDKLQIKFKHYHKTCILCPNYQYNTYVQSVLANQPIHNSLTTDNPRLTQFQTHTILKKEDI